MADQIFINLVSNTVIARIDAMGGATQAWMKMICRTKMTQNIFMKPPVNYNICCHIFGEITQNHCQTFLSSKVNWKKYKIVVNREGAHGDANDIVIIFWTGSCLIVLSYLPGGAIVTKMEESCWDMFPNFQFSEPIFIQLLGSYWLS